MINFEPGKEFLVAVQRPYKKDERIETRGLLGRIVEQISYMDYIEVWAWRGFDSEAISDSPRFYYRCELITRNPVLPSGKPPLTTETSSGEPLRGGEESGL